MLLTLPVLFAFYSMLSVAIELRGMSSCSASPGSCAMTSPPHSFTRLIPFDPFQGLGGSAGGSMGQDEGNAVLDRLFGLLSARRAPDRR